MQTDVQQKMQKTPKEILSEGIRLSTHIEEPKALEKMVDGAFKGETYAQTGTYDEFLFGIAESLEKIRCETTPLNEYFGWIDEAEHIMNIMTDGEITLADLQERNHFIDISFQREAELLTCLSLYEKSDHPLAKTRHAELLMKLRRLRQLRSSILTSTQNKQDKRPLTVEEKNRILSLRLLLRDMKEADRNGDFDSQMILERLEQFRISHAADVEFYKGYSFWTRLLEDQRRFDQNRQKIKEKMYVESFENLHSSQETEEDVRARILRLTGRVSFEQKRQRPIQSFGMDRFLRLRNLQEQEELLKG